MRRSKAQRSSSRERRATCSTSIERRTTSTAAPSPAPTASRHGRAVPGGACPPTAAARFIDAVDRHARLAGFSVLHDDPYRGGHSTKSYGRPEAGVHAVQVEIARRLYMDEATLRKRPDEIETMRSWCRGLVRALAD